jgi:hypothetical protein
LIFLYVVLNKDSGKDEKGKRRSTCGKRINWGERMNGPFQKAVAFGNEMIWLGMAIIIYQKC